MKRLAPSHAQRLRRSVGALAATALASGTLAGALALAAGPAQASPGAALSGPAYTFRTLNNAHDRTFNQLLGINDHGKIVGYFGSGAAHHPNKGYNLYSPFRQGNYQNVNFPGSRQTQVTGLNNGHVVVGFYSTQNRADLADNNFGFVDNSGHFRKVNFPARHPASPPVDQLLGINDSGLAVGFYVDSAGNSHGYLYNIHTNHYFSWGPGIHGVTSVTAAGINDADSVTGFFTNSKGDVRGFFVRKSAPHLFILNFPGSSATQPLGVSTHGEVVGVNTAGDLVGFYTDSKGNTDGFLAKP